MPERIISKRIRVFVEVPDEDILFDMTGLVSALEIFNYFGSDKQQMTLTVDGSGVWSTLGIMRKQIRQATVAEEWQCNHCGRPNERKEKICEGCGAPRSFIYG